MLFYLYLLWGPPLVAAEAVHEMAVGEVRDLGWEVTEPLNRWLKSHPRVNALLSSANTALMLYCLSILFNDMMSGRVCRPRKFLLLIILRACLGGVTRLPLSRDILRCATDIPPFECSFFHIFSGHTCLLYVCMGASPMGIGLLVVQSLRLLGTRGHYTVDICLGLLLTHLV